MSEDSGFSKLSAEEITAIIQYLAQFGGRADIVISAFSKSYKPVSMKTVKYIQEKYKDRLIEEINKIKKDLHNNPFYSSAYLLKCCLDVYYSAMKEKNYSYKDTSGEFVVDSRPEHTAALAALRLALDIKLDIEKLSIAKEKAGYSLEDDDTDYGALIEDDGLDLESIDTPLEDLDGAA